MPYIPHTDKDVAEMLAGIGADNTEALFEEIPAGLRVDDLPGVPEALTEAEITRLMRSRARRDGGVVSFLGAGAYEHTIPAAVWDVATRGEFYSAYTPYQAEASQGTLQLIYEYQTMMTGLTGLDVSNASLYDGATAFAEACLMAVRANRKSKSRRVLISRGVNPIYRSVTDAIVKGQGIELVEIPLRDGRTDFDALARFDGQDFAALCLQQPTFLGTIEEADAITDWAHERNILVIGACNPLSLALLKAPGDWGGQGADIVCGEGQPLGIPLSSGGPYFGYMVCTTQLQRQMPGRIVGRTLDIEGRTGYTLTLQAREQHIRRSKATSNICTNQGLMVTAATIHMSLLGAEGLRRVALACHANTRMLADELAQVDGASIAFGPYFHEAVVQLDRPAQSIIDTLGSRKILAGYDLSADYPELGSALLVCATEARTSDDIGAYVAAFKDAMKKSQAA
ncbi:MAG: aminomethyl-transferring glycine dehydrogenase subunit GcvPA [Gammaproteobacteria bacterium]